MLTARACRWAVQQIRREHGSVSGLARQLGTAWKTVWASILPILAAAAAEESRFADVTILGVDEHLWHHVSVKERGPKELTGMVDLSRDKDGRTRARLLDLVPGRSGTVYKEWLKARGDTFRAHVQVATLDPFRGYKNAIDDQFADATAVLDAFHVVKLATQAVDEVRRRVHATPTRGQARHRHQLLNLLITDAKDCEVLFTLTVQSRSRGEISPAHDGSVSNLQGWVASRGAARNPAAR